MIICPGVFRKKSIILKGALVRNKNVDDGLCFCSFLKRSRKQNNLQSAVDSLISISNTLYLELLSISNNFLSPLPLIPVYFFLSISNKFLGALRVQSTVLLTARLGQNFKISRKKAVQEYVVNTELGQVTTFFHHAEKRVLCRERRYNMYTGTYENPPLI